MNYEYNGNLLESDRINLVAQEIINKYPNISLEKAKEAAMLEGRISNSKDFNDELNRLYNIMLVNSNNKDIVLPVCKDFLTTINNNKDKYNGVYIELLSGIDDFLSGKAEFPIISDYQ